MDVHIVRGVIRSKGSNQTSQGIFGVFDDIEKAERRRDSMCDNKLEGIRPITDVGHAESPNFEYVFWIHSAEVE